jgi:hypothetical protein
MNMCGPALCGTALDHGPALCHIVQDFFVQNLYDDEYVWSLAMPHIAGQNCIALDKLAKLWTCAA